MKRLVYSHALVQSLLGASWAAISHTISTRLAPTMRRLLPGRRGRRLSAGIILFVSMVAQAFMLVLLAQLVELCISLFELWAFLGRKFVEADGS